MGSVLRNYIYVMRVDEFDNRVKLKCLYCDGELYVAPIHSEGAATNFVSLALIDEAISTHKH